MFGAAKPFSFEVSGGSGHQTQSSGTGHVKYCSVLGTDVIIKPGDTCSIGVKYHCITCMKEYENKSLEELRLEDYVKGRRRKDNAGGMFRAAKPFSFEVSGGSGHQTQASGTGHVKYCSVFGTDVIIKPGDTCSIGVNYHCITCMKEYKNKSLEELRLEDYVKGRRRKDNAEGMFRAAKPFSFEVSGSLGASAPSTGPFGSTSPASSSSAFSFNIPRKFAFGETANTSGGLFGANNMTGGVIGAQQNNTTFTFRTEPFAAFGQPVTTTPTSSVFGQPVTTTPTSSVFGQPVTTTPTSSVFGQPVTTTPTSSVFGQPMTTTTSSVLGQPVTTTPNSSVFGQPVTTTTSSVFGQPVTTTPTSSVFGQPVTTTTTSSVFGQPVTTTTTSSVFGQLVTTPTTSSVFGQPVTTTPTSSVFGQPVTTTTTSSVFGQLVTTPTSSVFGQPVTTTPTSSVFGQPVMTTPSSSVFGQPVTTTTSSVFGQPVTTTPTSSVFGQPVTTTTTSSVFGQLVTTTTTSSVFGQLVTTPTSSVFGQPVTTTTSSVFGQPVTTTPTSSVFGQPVTTTTTSSVFVQPVVTTPTSSVFGQPVTTMPTFSIFGQPVMTTTTSSVLGQPLTTTPTFSLFGQPVTTTPTFSVLGQPLTTPPIFGGFSKPVTMATTSSIFGQPVTTTPTFSVFGQPVTTTTTSSVLGQPVTTTTTSSVLGQLVTSMSSSVLGQLVTTTSSVLGGLARTSSFSETPTGQNTPHTTCTGLTPTNLPPLSFHRVHGANIHISEDGSIARRYDTTSRFGSGKLFLGVMAFSARPVRVNEKVCIRFVEMSNEYSPLSHQVGFTTHDPATAHNLDTLAFVPGNWLTFLRNEFCEIDNILYYYVNSAGDVHFGINGEDKGILFTGVDTRSSLWSLVQVVGNKTGIQYVDSADPNQIHRSLPRPLSDDKEEEIAACDNRRLLVTTTTSSLFGHTATTSPSVPGHAVTTTSSLFGHSATTSPSVLGQAVTMTSSLFGHTATTSPSVPGHAVTTTSSLFGHTVTTSPSVPGHAVTTTSSLFGHTATTSPSVPGHAVTTTSSLFGHTATTSPSVPGHAVTTTSSLFGHTVTTSFSVPGHAVTTTSSLFGHTATTSPSVPGHAVTTTSSMFGHTATTSPSVPGHAVTTTSSLFGHTATTSFSVPGHAVTTTSSLFGHTATTSFSVPGHAVTTTSSLFGHTATTSPSVPGHAVTTTSSLFGHTATTSPSVPGHAVTTTSSLFGHTATTSPSVSGHAVTTTSSLFGHTATTSPSVPGHAVTTTSSLFGHTATTSSSVLGTGGLASTSSVAQTPLGQNTPRTNCTGETPNYLAPLIFHRKHGTQVHLSEDRATVRRGKILFGFLAYVDGAAYSARPLRVNEEVCIRFVEESVGICKVDRPMFTFGFTNRDPATDPLQDIPYTWFHIFGESFCKKGNTICYHVNSTGDVYVGINGSLFNIFSTPNIDIRSPIWSVVDLDLLRVGTAIQYVNPKPPNQIRRSLPSSLPDDNVETLPDSVRSLSIDESLPPVRFQSQGVVPLALYVNDQYINDSEVVIKPESGPGYVFTANSMRPGQTLVVQILASESGHLNFGAFYFGLTSCDPVTLRISDLPFIAEHLVDRPEYWVVTKAADRLRTGDEVAVTLDLDGKVNVSKNGLDPVTIMHVDHTVRLWAFVDINRVTPKFRILSSQLPQQAQTPPRPLFGSGAGFQSLQDMTQHSSSRIQVPPNQQPAPVRPSRNDAQCSSSQNSQNEPLIPPSIVSNERSDTPLHLANERLGNDLIDTECTICYENPINSVLYMCGHMCMCYRCAEQQWRGKGDGKCPLCRAYIVDIIRTFKS